jgi:hypothetical protein
MAVAEGVKEALWLRGLLGDLGVRQEGVRLMCDSQSAIHIDIRYHFVWDVLDEGRFSLTKVHIDEHLVDMLTKAVSGSKFQHCLNLLNTIPFSSKI